MAEGILELADRVWRGEIAIEDTHPLVHLGASTRALEQVAPDTGFIPTLGNISAFRTADGLVLVDTGISFWAADHHRTIRAWDRARLHTAVYSHGHIDHVFGTAPFEEEARAEGWPAPRVVAHEAVPARFDRYVRTAGYNAVVNERQFGLPTPWPTEYRYPDETYRDALTLEVGGERFELHHARGETDDHTWTWIPSRRIVCTGDLFIWASPNAGNPQKVQRYPHDWARALRDIMAREPELLLPGHGFPIAGADRVAQALGDTADLLEDLHDRTVAMMNAGARLNDVIHEVRPPQHLLDKPYLRPVYDDPEFIVRNVWRFYGGWYDGNPAHLKPARERELASEIAALAGGANRLADRARALAADGTVRLAAHLAEMAALAAPDDPGVHGARAEVFRLFSAAEPSLMAKGIFNHAARESTERA